MENSGKLKKVIKARGGKDASQADFGGTSNIQLKQMAKMTKENKKWREFRQYTGKTNKGVEGNGTKKVTVRTGEGQRIHFDPRPLGLLNFLICPSILSSRCDCYKFR